MKFCIALLITVEVTTLLWGCATAPKPYAITVTYRKCDTSGKCALVSETIDERK